MAIDSVQVSKEGRKRSIVKPGHCRSVKKDKNLYTGMSNNGHGAMSEVEPSLKKMKGAMKSVQVHKGEKKESNIRSWLCRSVETREAEDSSTKCNKSTAGDEEYNGADGGGILKLKVDPVAVEVILKEDSAEQSTSLDIVAGSNTVAGVENILKKEEEDRCPWFCTGT